MLRSLRIFPVVPVVAACLAACDPSAAEADAPAPVAGGIATAAPGARGANFDPVPPPQSPAPLSAPRRSPSMKAEPPPDPFGGALPDDGAEPEPPVSNGVHL